MLLKVLIASLSALRHQYHGLLSFPFSSERHWAISTGLAAFSACALTVAANLFFLPIADAGVLRHIWMLEGGEGRGEGIDKGVGHRDCWVFSDVVYVAFKSKTL